MRTPARIKDWLTDAELAAWLDDAPDKGAYQKRLAIWLTHVGGLHAERVAELLHVSKQAVWLWVGQYNRQGPEGLARTGRGGRRWGFLTWAEEAALLGRLSAGAVSGQWLSVRQIRAELTAAIGREVSLAYVYRLLRRHGWRKLAPRPRHVRARAEAPAEFKKNSPPFSPKR